MLNFRVECGYQQQLFVGQLRPVRRGDRMCRAINRLAVPRWEIVDSQLRQYAQDPSRRSGSLYLGGRSYGQLEVFTTLTAEVCFIGWQPRWPLGSLPD